MATYLPDTSLTPLYTFIAFGGTVSALGTALNTAFPGMNIQTFADTTSGHTSNALVVVGDQQVFSVVPSNLVGYNLGTWTQITPDALAANYTAYP